MNFGRPEVYRTNWNQQQQNNNQVWSQQAKPQQPKNNLSLGNHRNAAWNQQGNQTWNEQEATQNWGTSIGTLSSGPRRIPPGFGQPARN